MCPLTYHIPHTSSSSPPDAMQGKERHGPSVPVKQTVERLQSPVYPLASRLSIARQRRVRVRETGLLARRYTRGVLRGRLGSAVSIRHLSTQSPICICVLPLASVLCRRGAALARSLLSPRDRRRGGDAHGRVHPRHSRCVWVTALRQVHELSLDAQERGSEGGWLGVSGSVAGCRPRRHRGC